MIAEKTIKICGKDVKMRYCAAAETGYEAMSGKSADVFCPTIKEKDDNGKPVSFGPPKAKTEDYLKLGVAAITAAYVRIGEPSPVSDGDILFDADPREVLALITSVIELRGQWYAIPETIPATEFENDGGGADPNAQPPASDSSAS